MSSWLLAAYNDVNNDTLSLGVSRNERAIADSQQVSHSIEVVAVVRYL
jgi:hypothetical protein